MFYTTEKLGPKRELTPEGFLLCRDVALARTGVQAYGPGETPLGVGRDGIIRVERTADEVFRPETIASFNGKPVVDEHPEQDGMRVDITPDNWRNFAVGVVLNPRRGKGIFDDLLLGDILITDQAAIAAVNAGKREVSCGYDADYFEVDEGLGEQRNIIGNHVALVAHGRCGPRCAIGDHDHNIGARAMKKGLMERVRDAFARKDDKALEEVLGEIDNGEGGDGDQHVHVHVGKTADEFPPDKKDEKDKKTGDTADRVGRLEKTVDSLSGTVQKIADKLGIRDEDPDDKDKKDKAADETGRLDMEVPEGATDSVRKARDSAVLVDSFQDTVAMAEVIAPGIRIPTFDKALKPLEGLAVITGLRKRALDIAYSRPETRSTIDELLGGRAYDSAKLSEAETRSTFRALAGVMRVANNQRGLSRDVNAEAGAGGGMGLGNRSIRTPADLNKRHAEFYKSH